MLPAMHTENIDTLEILSTLIESDAFISNNLLLCADSVTQRALTYTLI